MEQRRYSFVLEAMTPIAHHQETFGNTALCARRKVRQSDGSFAMIPIVSGDTMRHGLREAAALAFLDAAGLLGKESLTRAALRLLFNGGMLTGKGDGGSVSLDKYRELCELCPPLALLGGCCDSRIVPGRLQVEDAVLVCREQARFLEPWTASVTGEPDTCRNHVEEVQRVRMDPMLDPTKRKLLTDGEQVAAAGLLSAGERAHEEADDRLAKDAKSSMLPRSFETIVQGSLFSWSLSCLVTSELDQDTLLVMLAAFLYRPVVGGKRGTGHGQLRVVEARLLNYLRPADTLETVNIGALGKAAGSLFVEHVRERAPRIAEFLRSVDA